MTKLYIANFQTVANFECSLDDNPLKDMEFETYCSPQLVAAGTDLQKVTTAAKSDAVDEVLELMELYAVDTDDAPTLVWSGLELYAIDADDDPDTGRSREHMATVVIREVNSIN